MAKWAVLAWGSNKHGELAVNESYVCNSLKKHEIFLFSAPQPVYLPIQPLSVCSGIEHSMCATTNYKVMICGNSNSNRFCEKDEDKQVIYSIKKF